MDQDRRDRKKAIREKKEKERERESGAHKKIEKQRTHKCSFFRGLQNSLTRD